MRLTTTAAAVILLTSCYRSDAGENCADSDSTLSADSTDILVQESMMAENDIGMTVRSMANTINIGDALDSTEYNFEGVLTDGVGMPLFTDMSGMPGEWEVEVIDSTQVRIRNLDAGYLQPLQLLEYITSALGTEDSPIELEAEHDSGDTHIIDYRYGRTSLRMETRPLPIGDTGEVAPIVTITLRADSLSSPVKKAADPR